MECCDINNGIRLISEYKESFITTIGCVVPAGAAFEKPEERGSALFLEHTLFQVNILMYIYSRKKFIYLLNNRKR